MKLAGFSILPMLRFPGLDFPGTVVTDTPNQPFIEEMISCAFWKLASNSAFYLELHLK